MKTTEKDAKDFLVKIQKAKDLNNLKNGLINEIVASRKNLLDLNIVVGIDRSGSISNIAAQKFMLQLDAIKGLSRVKVIETDSKITAMYDYFKTSANRVVKLGRGGGTNFEEAFRKFKQLKPDAILFMTDGDYAGDVSDPGIPTGWILSKSSTPPFNFGEVVVNL